MKDKYEKKKYTVESDKESSFALNKKPDEYFSGWFFTACICVYMFFQIIYSVAITIVAQKTGLTTETVSEKTAFKFLAYCLCGAAIFACALYCCLKRKTNVAAYVGIKKFSVKYAVVATTCLAGLMFGLGKANDLFLYLLSKFGYNPPQITLPPVSIGNYLLGLLCICLLPAVFEEFLFRGVILIAFDGISTVAAVILNGVLFSLFHMSPAQTVYQFLVGATYALIARKSGSIIPTTVMHFLNNAIVLTLTYYFPQVDLYSGVNGIILMFVGLVLLLISCTWLFKQKSDENSAKTSEKLKIKDFYSFFGGAAVCLFMWFATLFVGA